MEKYQKKVCLRCVGGYIILSFDTALSLLLDYVKTDIVYYAPDIFMNYGINLINKFMELGEQEDDTLVIDYIIDNKENLVYNNIYSSIMYGLKHRIELFEDYSMEC